MYTDVVVVVDTHSNNSFGNKKHRIAAAAAEAEAAAAAAVVVMGLGNCNYNSTIDRKPGTDHMIDEPEMDRRWVVVVARRRRQRQRQQKQILLLVSFVELGVPETVFVVVRVVGVGHRGVLIDPLIQIGDVQRMELGFCISGAPRWATGIVRQRRT